jgi:hypothetical protein
LKVGEGIDFFSGFNLPNLMPNLMIIADNIHEDQIPDFFKEVGNLETYQNIAFLA